MNDDNVLVVGIDGACWPLVDRWLEAGKLPNLAALRNDGVWGDLRSCTPPVTCPAWKCYSTGKNPGKLGVFWWENLDLENRRSKIPNANSFDSRELWDVLNDHGISTGVVGMPTTYPPKELDGFMVAGGPGARDKGFASPRRVERDLKREFDYVPRPDYFADIITPEGRAEYAEKSVEQVDQDFKAAKYLYEREDPQFLQIVSFEINGPLQHFFYDDEPTERAWKIIDGHIGDLAPEFDHVFVVSDHGTSPMDKQFFIDHWLDEHGYLYRDRAVGEWLAERGLHLNRIMNIIDRLHMRNFLSRFQILHDVARHIPSSEGMFGEAEGAAIFEKVDWERTTAVGLAQGTIYLNDNAIKDGTYEEVRASIVAELEALVDPETGSHPIEKVFKKEDIYEGDHVDKAPDLVALDAPAYHNKGGIGKDTIFADSEWRGNNAKNGLYVVEGPAVSPGERSAEIYDLAPTILDLFAVPVPDGIDGERLDAVDANGVRSR